MKINALITRNFVTVSVLEDTRDVSEWLHRDDYVVVMDEHDKVLGILTLKDLHGQPDARNVLDCEFSKPHVSPQQGILEAFNVMRQVGSNYLPVFDDEGFCGVISLTALTARLINIAEENKQEIQRAIHDLRNPISNLQAVLGLLKSTITDEDNNELIHLCILSCKHTSDILDDLLYVEVDENKPLVRTNTELNTFYKECIAEQHGLFVLKDIEIQISLSSVDYCKDIDRMQIKRAIQNVISNAVKFSYPKSKIKISSKVENSRLVLKIVDSGVGIPVEYQPEIFKKFTRAGRPGTSGEPSTGLGLCFTKQCIEQHGGRISFASTEGRGTKFYIVL